MRKKAFYFNIGAVSQGAHRPCHPSHERVNKDSLHFSAGADWCPSNSWGDEKAAGHTEGAGGGKETKELLRVGAFSSKWVRSPEVAGSLEEEDTECESEKQLTREAWQETVQGSSKGLGETDSSCFILIQGLWIAAQGSGRAWVLYQLQWSSY